MKVWITTDVLRKGIREREVFISSYWTDVVSWQETGARVDEYAFGEAKNWHRTRAGAIARAEEMRLARIEALKNELARLEALRFEMEDGP